MGNKKETFLTEVQGALKTPQTFYEKGLVNRRGYIEGEKYTEIIAGLLSEDSGVFDAIPVIARQNYNAGHKGEIPPGPPLRQEDRFAIELYRSYCSKTLSKELGFVKDYQIPLKRVNRDTAGKIDLFCYQPEEQAVTLLELKREESKETLLRAVLQIYTYAKILHKQNFLVSYKLPENAQIRLGVLLYRDSAPAKELQSDTNIALLMRRLSVRAYFIEKEKSFNVSEQAV